MVPCFSIALDESTDVNDVAQLCVWVLFPQNESFREELLCLLPLQGQTRGEDILIARFTVFDDNNIDWSNLASVCTEHVRDGEGTHRPDEKESIFPNLLRSIVSFIRKHLWLNSDCDLQNVMQQVVRVMNIIIARALNHRQCQT